MSIKIFLIIYDRLEVVRIENLKEYDNVFEINKSNYPIKFHNPFFS